MFLQEQIKDIIIISSLSLSLSLSEALSLSHALSLSVSHSLRLPLRPGARLRVTGTVCVFSVCLLLQDPVQSFNQSVPCVVCFRQKWCAVRTASSTKPTPCGGPKRKVRDARRLVSPRTFAAIGAHTSARGPGQGPRLLPVLQAPGRIVSRARREPESVPGRGGFPGPGGKGRAKSEGPEPFCSLMGGYK